MILPDGLGPAEALAVLAIFALAGFVKGVLGFGLPMISMTLLVFVGPVEMALALNSVVQPASNIQQFLAARRTRETAARFWPILATLAPGVAVGAYFLTSLSEEALLATIGAFVAAFAVYTALGFSITIPPARERAISFVLGFAAGVLGALTTANGPIFVTYLVSLRVERAMFRAALGMLFLASGALVAVGFLSVGVLDAPRAALAVASIPAALAGMWAGERLGARLGGAVFRNMVLAALFLLGVNFILRGLGIT